MKKKLLSIIILSIFILIVSFLVSCTKNDTENIKIGISLMNRQQIFYQELEKSFIKTAEENNIKLDISNASQNSTKQLNDVEGIISGGIDALILCPVDSTTSANIVKLANNKNIPVFTVDIGSNGGKVLCHIASNNIEGGKLAGEYMVKILEEKGNVIILDSPKVTSVQDRVEGFKEILKNYPDMKILEDIDAGAQKEPAMRTMEYMLQAHKDINGVFAINDETAMGAILAIENAKRTEIKIVGYDATPEARTKIEENSILKADIAQNPGEMGKVAIETVIKSLNGEEVPENIMIDVSIFD